MIYLPNKKKISEFSNAILFVGIVIFATSCSYLEDNATRFADDLESAAGKLKSQKVGSEYTITYEPDDAETPFTILVLSDKGVTSEELIERGLDSAVVQKLYPQLDYIDLKKGSALIVFQNGRSTFTSYYRHFVDVAATQIITGKGSTDIIVRKTGVASGLFAKKVLTIELELRI